MLFGFHTLRLGLRFGLGLEVEGSAVEVDLCCHPECHCGQLGLEVEGSAVVFY